jgi:pentatricopeptide repeat protein
MGDMRTYNMMMKSLTSIKEWDQAMSVMSEMRAQGLHPDADSLSSLFDV